MDGDLLLKADDSVHVLKELGARSTLDCIKIKTKFKIFVSYNVVDCTMNTESL